LVFQKFHTKKRSIHVIEQLLQAIQSGAYQPGDRLPSERDMAEQMGVSRAAVREGLAALAMQGIVRIKHGDGTYVLRIPDSYEIRGYLRGGDASIWETIEARRALEDVNARLAATRADAGSLAEIERSLKEMQTAFDQHDFDRYLDANMDFHLAIAKATKNRLLYQMTHHLVHVMELYQQARLDYYVQNPERSRTLLGHHQAIYQAIKERDPEQASRMMHEHFDYFEQTAHLMELE
jgi:GntR family transcriptional repressor for pyruvate dehydrogenase complex